VQALGASRPALSQQKPRRPPIGAQFADALARLNMAGELLAVAAQQEARQIDEKLFLETCSPPAESKAAGGRRL